MNNIKRNLIASVVLTTLAGFSAIAVAGSHHFGGKDVERNVIKVKAEQGEDVFILVGENGERNKYELSFEELENMDNVAAKLDDLDEVTKTKVLDLLVKAKDSDAKVIEFKDAHMIVDGSETDVFMIKKGNGEDQVHIEIDVEGAGASGEKHLMIKKLFADGPHSGKRHRIIKQKINGKKNPTELIKRIINKAELSAEQIAEIREALDNK